VRPLAVRVEARAGGLADGELRAAAGAAVAPAPGAVALRGAARRRAAGAPLRRPATADPTRVDEQLVVTLDAQLFYGVLDALPYLVDYPYECTEQTLNRFLSTAILGALFDRYPAVGRMAAELAQRATPAGSASTAPTPTAGWRSRRPPGCAQARGGEDEPATPCCASSTRRWRAPCAARRARRARAGAAPLGRLPLVPRRARPRPT
jgi:alpha-2-macroglobulin